MNKLSHHVPPPENFLTWYPPTEEPQCPKGIHENNNTQTDHKTASAAYVKGPSVYCRKWEEWAETYKTHLWYLHAVSATMPIRGNAIAHGRQ